MNKALMEDPVKFKDFLSIIPMGRLGDFRELTGAVVFLASDAS